MPDTPLFSIILPVLNAGKKLRASVDSVLEQGESVEIIILDGGSQDGCLEGLGELAENVRVFVEPGLKVYPAMNLGLKKARGKIHYFMGAGDRLRPGILRKVAQFWPQDSLVMLYGDVWMEDLGCYYDGEFTAERLRKKNICHQAIFYSGDVLARHGGYDERYPILADYAVNVRIFGDATVRKTYVPWIIADYEGNGLSANTRDAAFESDKKDLMHQYLGTVQKK